MGVLNTINLLLSVTDKLMDKLPDYEQRKKEKFLKMKRRYENEKAKQYPDRDDNLIGIYRDRILRFIAIFNSEISG